MSHRLLLLITILATIACASGAGATHAGAPREVVVTADQFGTEIAMRVDDVLVIPVPADYDEWIVDYAREVLESLDDDGGRRRPSSGRWRFRAREAGATDLVFTPIVSDAPRPSGGGAPNVPKFSLSVTVQ